MKLSISRFVFVVIALLSTFVIQAFAQPKLSVNLEVSQIPKDGVFFGQVSLVSLKDKIKSEGSRFDAVFRDEQKTYPAQIVLEPHFDDNHQAMLLISAPSQQQLKGVLELTPAPQSIIDTTVASTKGANWEFSAKRGIFPTRLQITDSGKNYTKYTWEDRLHSKKLSSYRLYREGNGTLQLLSDGPVATVIRGQAQYLGKDAPEVPELPKATYDWYFFKNSPLVYVDIHQSASTGFLWDETHFMEWNFKEKYFSGYLSNSMKAPTPLEDKKSMRSTTGWAALTSDRDAVAMIRDGVTIYDGVSGFGNYIRPREPSVNQVWDGNQRRLSAWLWASAYSSTSQLSSELNQASKTVKSRFAESSAKVVANDSGLNISSLLSNTQAKDVASASWVRALAHHQGIAQIPATWKFAKSGDLGIVLDVQKTGAKLVSLFDLKTNRELTADSAAPLFSIQMLSPIEGGVIALDASRRWGNVKFENRSTGFSLLFDDSADVERVSVEINALANNEDSSWTWSINIGNKGSAWAVQNVLFPQVKLRDLGQQSETLLPTQSGRVIKHPFNSSQRITGLYPTRSAVMQFMAAYNKDENPTGLYVARHDETASIKEFILNTSDVDKTQFLTFEQPSENLNIAGNEFRYGGKGVWKLLHGDWFDASLYYKKWVKAHAPWYPEMDDNGRKDSPQWSKELNFWALKGGGPSNSDAETIRLKNFIGEPIAIHHRYWHQIPFDNDYPHYFPVIPTFRESIKTLQENGVRVMPYTNGRLWDTRDRGLEDYQFSKVAKQWATKTLKGDELVLFTSMFGSRETDGSRVVLAVMCPATKLWQDTVVDFTTKLTDEFGVDSVYHDQIGASRPVLCMDPSHGHPLGGGSWWVDGYNKMLREIQQQIPNDRTITTEDNAEPYMKYMDSMLTWFWYEDGLVPAYSTVYGSAVQLFGRSHGSSEDKNIVWPIRTGQSLAWGLQIGWIAPGTFFGSDQSTQNYFKDVVQARQRIGKYIYAGDMMRPPSLESNPTIDSNWGTKYGKRTTPSVMTGAWKKYGENKAAFVFTNTTRNDLSLKYNFNPQGYGIPASYSLKEWNSSQSQEKVDTVTKSKSYELSLPGLSTIVWEISW